MEATPPLAPGRSTLALEADNLSAYPQLSSGTAQDSSRYSGEQPNPTPFHLGVQLNSNDSQDLCSNDSNFLAQIQREQQQQQQLNSQYDYLSWPRSRQSSTALASSAISTVIAGHHPIEERRHKSQHLLPASFENLHEAGPMSVSLNHRGPLGNQAGFGHASLASSFSFGHTALRRSLSNESAQRQQQQQLHHWNPSRSLFTQPTESYVSSRNTPSPTSKRESEHHLSRQSDSITNPHFQSNMSGHSDAVGVSGLLRSPNSQAQYHTSQDQYGQRSGQGFPTASPRGSIVSSGQVVSSQPRTAYDVGISSSMNNARDVTDSGAYRGPSPNTSLGITGFASKLGGGIHHAIPDQSSYQMYNNQQIHESLEPPYHHQQHQQHQQHGLPSPNHAVNPMRPIPAPASLQSLESGGSGRTYSSFGNPASAPPLLPGLSGSVMPSPAGQMALMSNMGMPYSSTGSPGGGMGAPGGSYIGRSQPLLYSHNTLHAHHLNPHPIGHHHLSNILTGKSHPGIAGPAAIHDRPFKCDQCPQSFNRNHDLKRHKRIHLAVKPFPCNYCEKSFSRKDALKRHRLVKGCGERAAETSRHNASSAGGYKPPAGSVLSDYASEGGHDSHRILR